MEDLTATTQIITTLPFRAYTSRGRQHWMSAFDEWWQCPEREQVRNEIAAANNWAAFICRQRYFIVAILFFFHDSLSNNVSSSSPTMRVSPQVLWKWSPPLCWNARKAKQ
jgi:hypothetical protein